MDGFLTSVKVVTGTQHTHVPGYMYVLVVLAIGYFLLRHTGRR